MTVSFLFRNPDVGRGFSARTMSYIEDVLGYSFDVRARRWRDVETGRFVGADTVAEEFRDSLDLEEEDVEDRLEGDISK